MSDESELRRLVEELSYDYRLRTDQFIDLGKEAATLRTRLERAEELIREARMEVDAGHYQASFGWTACADAFLAPAPPEPPPAAAVPLKGPKCGTCGGSGWIPDNCAPGYSERCPTCKGTGRTPEVTR